MKSSTCPFARKYRKDGFFNENDDEDENKLWHPPNNYRTSTPTSIPTSVIPENENIKRLIGTIAEKQLSVKEMMAAVGLKDRPNFIEYSLSPAMKNGYVRLLYPDSPRHPRQKYLLTVKGLAVFKEIKG